MAQNFDPYHRWLGIRAGEQPADHYRLLGLARFEDDPEVIRDAAERQMAHVRRYALGEHADDTQRILNELAAAKSCLLDPYRKAHYDGELSGIDAASGPASPAEPSPAGPPPVEFATEGKHFPPDRQPGLDPLREPPLMWSADAQTLGPETQPRRRAARRPFRTGPAETVKIVLGGIAGLLFAYSLLRFRLGIDLLEPGVTRDPRLAAKVHDQNSVQVPTKPKNLLPGKDQTAAPNAAQANVPGASKGARDAGVRGAAVASDGSTANEASAASARTTAESFPYDAARDPQYADIPSPTLRRLAHLRRRTATRRTSYCLPAEAEWEYACRAGAQTRYSFGDDPSALDRHAWHAGNSEGQLHPIGQLEPNAFGLYDMQGNADEWCADCFGPYDNAPSPLDDPTGPLVGMVRVLRGGSIASPPEHYRCGSRLPIPLEAVREAVEYVRANRTFIEEERQREERLPRERGLLEPKIA